MPNTPFDDHAKAGFGPSLLPILPPDAGLSEHSKVMDGNRGKVPGQRRQDGKWTGFPNWQSHVVTPADVKLWDHWHQHHGCGLGLNSTSFPGIDVDVQDAAFAQQVVTLARMFLGPAPERMGKAPRRLLIYAQDPNAAPIRKVRVVFRLPTDKLFDEPHAVEVLGHGQQYVVMGRHKSGVPYTFTGKTTLDMGAAGLRRIGPQDIEAFRNALVDAVQHAGGYIEHNTAAGTASATPTAVVQEGLEGNPEKIREALEAMGNDLDYDGWITMTAAIKAALGGDEAHYDIYEDWCLMYPGNTPAEARKKWDSMKPPYRVGADYVFRKAAEKGWGGYGATVFTALPDPANDHAAIRNDWICPADLASTLPRPRDWIVEGWLPNRHVTVLSGVGGSGKTTLSQQLATAVATGTAFLGVPVPTAGPVLAVFAEDDQDELHRRQQAMNRALGRQMTDLKNVRWMSPIGKDNALVRFGPDGGIRRTDFYERLRRAAKQYKPRLVILDNVAQMFPGNENSRPEVTAFVNLLTGFARDFECGVLLLAHPAKGEGSEYSGSTAWDACVRSRWYFGRPKGDDGTAGPPTGDHRILRRSKSNYAPAGTEIACRYIGGAFVPLTGPTGATLSQADHDQSVFLAALDELTAQGRTVTDSVTSPTRYAPKVLATMPAARSADVTVGRLKTAMGALLAEGYIAVGQTKMANRKTVAALVKTGKPFAPDTTAPAGAPPGGNGGPGPSLANDPPSLAACASSAGRCLK